MTITKHRRATRHAAPDSDRQHTASGRHAEASPSAKSTTHGTHAEPCGAMGQTSLTARRRQPAPAHHIG